MAPVSRMSCAPARSREYNDPLRKKTVCHVEVLTAEVWSPPLVDFGSSTLASISVGLELITQYMLLAIEPTHVIYAALEERSGIHHIDTLPRTEKTLIQIGEEKFRVQFCVRYWQFGLAHEENVGYLSIN